MWKDPIVEEIRRIRLGIEAACENDFDKIFAQAIEAQEQLTTKLFSKPALNPQMSDTTSKRIHQSNQPPSPLGGD